MGPGTLGISRLVTQPFGHLSHDNLLKIVTREHHSSNVWNICFLLYLYKLLKKEREQKGCNFLKSLYVMSILAFLFL